MQHTELAAHLPQPKQPNAAERRKMVAIDRETYDDISQISEETSQPRSKVIKALVDFYFTTVDAE